MVALEARKLGVVDSIELDRCARQWPKCFFGDDLVLIDEDCFELSFLEQGLLFCGVAHEDKAVSRRPRSQTFGIAASELKRCRALNAPVDEQQEKRRTIA